MWNQFDRVVCVRLCACVLTLPATLLALLNKHVSMKLGQLIPGEREEVTGVSSTEILPGASEATFLNIDIKINTHAIFTPVTLINVN